MGKILKRTKKATEHRSAVRKWRNPYMGHGLVYRKIAGHFYWIPKRRS